jgi:RHS repeat-associated protein
MISTDKATSKSDGEQKPAAPSIALPKGGGAVRGIGEKFAANPVTGTGSMSVPIATSPGRAGFGPQLSLSYDSGAGNGPFGLGWNLSLPSITRKTDKGLPKYRDAEESDVFILSGAEDLVPVLLKNGNAWVCESLPTRKVSDVKYRILRYRPRIEGLFARIERWTSLTDASDTFWRSISKDNITTWYGKTAASRIADPADSSRIFSWLICESCDDKGNVIIYQYNPEDSAWIFKDAEGNSIAKAHERNRDDTTRSANRYLKRIRYGNRVPYLPELSECGAWPAPPGSDDPNENKDWLFEVIFDYGEHDANAPTPSDAGAWRCRNDPFSAYRAGFEVRTYRLCQRVLMFHHFKGEKEVGENCLVRSTDFTYSLEDNPADARNPVYSQILSATQFGYKRQGAAYLRRSLPPVEFDYSKAQIDPTVRTVSPESLENLPIGLDGAAYQWIDLDGEGLSGILTEQADAWFYKRNLSPIHVVGKNGSAHVEARFAPVERVATKPNLALAGHAQFMNLAGDGRPDVVQMEGPIRGFYERTDDLSWKPFRAFTAWPNVDTRDPSLKFVDLNGDGHSDILIADDRVFRWHPSLAEDGFGPCEFARQASDEENGPCLVFADGTQSIYLADLSGDGLTDLVRIRNGEVCYWPNLGYGRFGAKVTMDNAPWFDHPDQFDQRRIRLADIDGSGTTDIIYLHGDGPRLYFNQSGNGWSQSQKLDAFPAVDSLASIQVVDLLGNGTAGLVWSSPLPGNADRQMRYIDLMGGQKPHLLVKTTNNLGAETLVEYAPSTKFYLQDKQNGKPWVTRLPFPVHVVEKVTVTDRWRKTSFSSTYSYHHGYFDGVEREFRGFGRVEQVDVEAYGKFEQDNSDSPYLTSDKTLYQPPVKTVTWYHTGAFLDREHILSHFRDEYFPRWFEEMNPGQQNVLGDFQEADLPEPDLDAEGLTHDEWRQALRACKGMALRQEVYELDVDALERGEQCPVKLFTTAFHNCHIRRLQPQAGNHHAVFLVAESEAVTYHYELDLRPGTVKPDPRIAHTLNLKYDEYGNVVQSVAVAYPRLGRFEDDAQLAPGLADALPRIQQVQRETHLAYTEARYTNDVEGPDSRRLRVPCEVLTYELTGIGPEDAGDRATPDRRDNRYFTLDELRCFRLSPVHQSSGDDVGEIAYQEIPNRSTPQKRLVEHVRMTFFEDDTPTLTDCLPLGKLGRLGLPYETYKLALTDALLDAVFNDGTGGKLDQTISSATARSRLNDPKMSGYLSGPLLATRFPNANTDGQYWVRSGIAGFAPDAAQHFYLPERYTDPFDNITAIEYNPLDLFVQSSTDMLGNTTRVTGFDYRVLAPREMQDINDNLSEVYFDVLGLPVAMAVKGKGNEGDDLTSFDDILANPPLGALVDFFTAPNPYNETQARTWLGNATARHVYYFGDVEEKLSDGSTVVRWGRHPACTCGIVREWHVNDPPLPPGPVAIANRIQSSFEYSDGMGTVLVKKVQAEPETRPGSLRWVANGRTILNNKGKPVKQYEPYFSSSGHRFEEPKEEGVTPVMYYDAPGRLIRTELPDGSFSRVEFSPWHVLSSDPNDTVLESQWFADRSPPDLDKPLPRDLLTGRLLVTPDQRAAWLTAQHANTPSLTVLDSLAREVISIVHNRVKDPSGTHTFGGQKWKDECCVTFTKLDAEGKPLWIRDARQNLVMQYIRPPVPNNQATDPVSGFAPCYDIAGNLLFQHSMDAGDRWMLNDAAGKPMIAWDSRGHVFLTEYDVLHRPLRQFVRGTSPNHSDPAVLNRDLLVDRIVYGEAHAQNKALNLCGKPFLHLDQAGVVTNEDYDFKGNLRSTSRTLAIEYKTAVDWSPLETVANIGHAGVAPVGSGLPPDPFKLSDITQALAPLLESEKFSTSTAYDALNRPVEQTTPDDSVTRRTYNEANLLEAIHVNLRGTRDTNNQRLWTPFITNIDYNPKGQRILIQYGNGAETRYRYDPETFRLIRLYTRRGASFTADCENPQPPPPPTIAAPDEPPPGKLCGLQNLQYSYDPVGNITGIRDDAQQAIFFKGAVVEPSNEYQYDALYRLIAATGREHLGQTNNAPNPPRRLDHDDSFLMNQPHPSDGQAMGNYRQTYEYDAVGNILSMRHRGANPDQPGWKRCYQYALDSNRLLSTGQPSDPRNPDSDCPTRYAATPVFSEPYAYNQHGSMTQMPHLSQMQWDFREQLQTTQQQVVGAGLGEKTYCVYDAGGQRVRKVTETSNQTKKNERLYLDGFETYREYNNTGTMTLERETLHVMDDKQRIALVETMITENSSLTSHPPSLKRYQFGNHLGSASLELDDQAQIISYEEYAPYGSTSYQAVRSQTETPKRYRYTGKERDEQSGLNHHGARYYAPWLGRWTSCDPNGIGDGTNCYSYTRDNPVVFTDETGSQSQSTLEKLPCPGEGMCFGSPSQPVSSKPESNLSNPTPESLAAEGIDPNEGMVKLWLLLNEAVKNDADAIDAIRATQPIESWGGSMLWRDQLYRFGYTPSPKDLGVDEEMAQEQLSCKRFYYEQKHLCSGIAENTSKAIRTQLPLINEALSRYGMTVDVPVTEKGVPDVAKRGGPGAQYYHEATRVIVSFNYGKINDLVYDWTDNLPNVDQPSVTPYKEWIKATPAERVLSGIVGAKDAVLKELDEAIMYAFDIPDKLERATNKLAQETNMLLWPPAPFPPRGFVPMPTYP